MKLHTRFLAAMLLAICYLSSCEGPIEDVSPEDMELRVSTQEPIIGESTVTFKGTLENLPPDTQVEYGFMWYAKDDDEDVKRVVIGRRVVKGAFQSTLVDLPKEKDLVVCAYVINSHTTWDEEVTGEERDFWWNF